MLSEKNGGKPLFFCGLTGFIFANSNSLFMRSLLQLFLLAVLLALPNLGKAQDDKDSMQYVIPKSSHASLDLYTAPEGFVVANQFNGYYNPLSQTTIVLTMVENVNYVNIKRGLNEEYYAGQRLTVVEEKEITTDSGLKGFSVKCSFELDGKQMFREMVFIGDLNKTLWLSVTYHRDMAELVSPLLVKSYQSVHFTK